MSSIASPNLADEVAHPLSVDLSLDKRARFDLLRSKLRASTVDLTLPSKPSVECPLPLLLTLFPDGLELGNFIELIQPAPGNGASHLAFQLSKPALITRPAWAIIDQDSQFYAPGLASLALDLKHLILLRPSAAQASWVVSQVIRSTEIGVTLWHSPSMDNMLFRRIQLAAEKGGGLGFCIRPAEALHRPCWGSARLKVERIHAEKVRVTLLYARKRQLVGSLSVEVPL